MLETLEGTKRYLVTRYTTDEPDKFEALPSELRQTISEVHFADGSNPDLLGLQGTYGIDLDPEHERLVRSASNLIDLIEVDAGRLGEYVEHTTSEVIEPLSDHMGDVPELGDLDVEALLEGAIREASPDGAARTYRYYRPGGITDQGQEGACTGHCRLNFLTASPIRSFPDLSFARRNQLAHDYYIDNQRNDEWPGENYTGSSVSAVVKCLIRDGFIKSGGVTDSFEEMVRWKLYKGPLMLSTPWYEGMYRTDANGFIRPTGKKVGGHALIDRAVTAWRTGILRNSWGLGFGFHGNGYLAEADYRWLITQGLRAYTAIQVA